MSKMSVGGLTGSGSANSRVLNHLAGSACSPLPLQRADFGANGAHFSPPRSPSVSVSGQLVNNPEAVRRLNMAVLYFIVHEAATQARVCRPGSVPGVDRYDCSPT